MDELQEWQSKHLRIIEEFLHSLGSASNFVLKGDTALTFCYGFSRFSSDLSFDALIPQSSIIQLVDSYCTKLGYSYTVEKDTGIAQCATVHYGGIIPIKIEASSRRTHIDNEEIAVINGVKTYCLHALASMKLSAYGAQNRISDLYDITYFINHYWEQLPEATQRQFQYVLSAKGLEQFDLAIAQNTEDAIDTKKLSSEFLNAYSKIGLLASESDKNVATSIALSSLLA